MEQARKHNRNIYTAFIDYKKAYDSVPHTWLIQVLKLYKIHPNIIDFLEHVMNFWKTTLNLCINNINLKSNLIHIKRGIFQGDSLSPLWFCLAINPLSDILKNTDMGFQIKINRRTESKITHLLYMDDIKLYASKKKDLTSLLKLTENFSSDIGMTFGIDKCKIQSITRGHLDPIQYETSTNEYIDHLNNGDIYKYLGYSQSTHLHHTEIKTQLQTKFYTRTKLILKSFLNGKNLIKAVNTYAVPLLTYSFGIIKWSNTDIQNINIKVRTLFTKYRKHHPKSCIERFTLPRVYGGRGFLNLKNLQNQQISLLRKYFLNNSRNSSFIKAILSADKKYTPLNLSCDNILLDITDHNKIIDTIKGKTLHSRFYKELEQQDVDKNLSHLWLKKSNIFPETEGFIFAIQDQIIKTRNYMKHIIKDSSISDDRCRICSGQSETIDHIISSCTVLAATQYKNRHDMVARIIHLEIAKNCNLKADSIPDYLYTPESYLENDKFKLYWDRTVLTDLRITANRPDLILVSKEQKQVYLVDIAIPNSFNISQTYQTKISKYMLLCQEIKNLWQIEKIQTLPLIISATGLIHNKLLHNLKLLNLKETTLLKMQKSVILNTCSIVRKFFNCDIDIRVDNDQINSQLDYSTHTLSSVEDN